MNDAITGAACFYLASSDRLRCPQRLLLCARTNTKTFAVSAPAAAVAAAAATIEFKFLVKYFQSSGSCETGKSEQEREERNKLAFKSSKSLSVSILCAGVHMRFYFQIYKKPSIIQLHAVARIVQMLHSFINGIHLLVYRHQYNDDASHVC